MRGGTPSVSRNSVRDEAPDMSWSSMRDGAPDVSRFDTKQETWDDDKRPHEVKFLLSQDVIPSKSQVRQVTAHEGNGIKRPGLTSIFAHQWATRHLSQDVGARSFTSFQSHIEVDCRVKVEIVKLTNWPIRGPQVHDCTIHAWNTWFTRCTLGVTTWWWTQF